MIDFRSEEKYIFGLVHLLPLPGTPFYKDDSLGQIIEKAVRDALALSRGGAHGCLIQTVDGVYTNTDDTDPARIAAMTLIVDAVKQVVPADFLIGVQMMWNCITPSLAVAKICGVDFIRCSVLVGASDSPYGPVTGQPFLVQEYRKKLNASDISLIAEIKGYHFKGEGETVEEVCSRAYFATYAGADAVEIVDADEEKNGLMAKAIRDMGIPVVLGGGTNSENVQRRMEFANAAFVGSHFQNKDWGGAIDEEAVKAYMEALNSI